jgi:hypothetical protein
VKKIAEKQGKTDILYISIAVFLLAVLLYAIWYSKGYDDKIGSYYHDYIIANCKNELGIPIFQRPQPYQTIDIIKGVVLNETKNKDKHS